MLSLLREMRDAADIAVAAQPSAFRTTDECHSFTRLPEFPDALETIQIRRSEFAEFGRIARSEGIRYVGGCCGCNAAYIRSLAEGVSNTILEAMATALPVLATRVGGNPELVEEGITGRLVPAANSRALADAMLQYLHDPAAVIAQGKAGRERVERRFSLDRMVASYDDLYSQLITRLAPASTGLQAT